MKQGKHALTVGKQSNNYKMLKDTLVNYTNKQNYIN